MPELIIPQWIRESNLIEDVDSPIADATAFDAWSWLRMQPELSLSVILKTHEGLASLLDPPIAGKWRTWDVQVGQHIAPPFERVVKLIQRWVQYHGVASDARSIKKAHIEFERIHPFADFNGRTGRMLMAYQREKADLPILCIKASEKYDYYRWFE